MPKTATASGSTISCSGYLKGAPAQLIYKIVRSGQVRVNGGRVKADRRLEGGDEVRIPPVRLDEPAEKGTPAKGLLEAMEASIVFEDARLLAINKPSGVASHGGSGISFGAIETLRALRPHDAGAGAPAGSRYLRPARAGQEALGADRVAGADARRRRHRQALPGAARSAACPTAR